MALAAPRALAALLVAGALAALLLIGAAPPALAAFPGANGKIAFASDQHCPLGSNANPGNPSGCGEQIYTMNPDGTNQTRLTQTGSIERFPAWSPDGTRIVFASGRDCSARVQYLPGQPCSLEIYVMNADGSGQRRLTTDRTNTSQNPVFSPDGQHIAFWKLPVTAPAPNQVQLVTMDADGSNQKTISDGTAPDLTPAWSPNPSSPPASTPPGELIAFTRLRVSGSLALGGVGLVDANTFVAKPDGSGVVGPLGGGGGVAGDVAPRWSPDQTALVFMSARQCNLTAPSPIPAPFGTGLNRCNLEIWTMPVTQGPGGITAGTPRRLTQTFVSGCSNDSSSSTRCVSNFQPNFSPDASKVVFYSDRTANPNDRGDDAIYVMNTDGSGAVALTSNKRGPNKANSNDPDWQPIPDRTPPLSVATIPACSPTGRIAVTVTDERGGAGAKAVHARIDAGAEQVVSTTGNPGSATILVPSGRHQLEYWGADAAGNQEAAHHTATVIVDTAKPTVTIRPRKHKRGRVYRLHQRATVKITARDDQALSRDPSKKRVRLRTRRAGQKTLKATAVDICGNSATATFKYRVHRAHRAVRRPPRFTG